MTGAAQLSGRFSVHAVLIRQPPVRPHWYMQNDWFFQGRGDQYGAPQAQRLHDDETAARTQLRRGRQADRLHQAPRVYNLFPFEQLFIGRMIWCDSRQGSDVPFVYCGTGIGSVCLETGYMLQLPLLAAAHGRSNVEFQIWNLEFKPGSDLTCFMYLSLCFHAWSSPHQTGLCIGVHTQNQLVKNLRIQPQAEQKLLKCIL